MDAEREKLIAKVNKLLRLANSNHEAEAEAASTKAMELLMRYNISQAELAEGERKYEKETVGDQTADLTYAYIADLLVKYFRVRVMKCPGYNEILGMPTQEINIHGEAHNVEIAKYMLVYLTRAFKDSWKEARIQQKLDQRDETAFYMGMHHRLKERLEKMKEKVAVSTGKDLTLYGRDPHLWAFVDRLYPNSRRASWGSPGSAEATAAGAKAGESIRLQRVVRKESSNQGRLLT